MAHEILLKQNDNEHLKLLRASTSAYRSAKTGEISVTYSLLFLSIAYPIAYIFIKDETTKHILFGGSFSITVFVLIFSGVFKGNTSKGAIFKEEFDTSLFGLPWKSTLRKPDHIEVSHFAKQYKGEEIKDWYSTNLSTSIPNNIAIAVLQHTNTSWDIQLRKTYRQWLIYFLLGYSTVLTIIIIVLNIDSMTVFLLFFSLLSFYSHFANLIKGHSSAIEKREAISKHLDEIIQNKKYIGINELRDVQDEIYITRQEAAKVPNFFFEWYKEQMNEEAEDYIKSVNEIYGK